MNLIRVLSEGFGKRAVRVLKVTDLTPVDNRPLELLCVRGKTRVILKMRCFVSAAAQHAEYRNLISPAQLKDFALYVIDRAILIIQDSMSERLGCCDTTMSCVPYEKYCLSSCIVSFEKKVREYFHVLTSLVEVFIDFNFFRSKATKYAH